MKKGTGGTGLGQRLIERIKAKGYADPSAKFGIKVTEFALDHRYPPGFVYKWIADVVVPEHETMLKLAKELNTTAGWLHYGEEPPAPTPSRARRRKPVPISGGSGEGPPLAAEGARHVTNTPCLLSDIGRWLRDIWARPLLLPLCPA